MASEVGSAYVTLLPSAKGFAQRMQAELAGEVARAGTSLGEELGQEVGESGGKEAAQSFGSRLKDNLGKVTALAGGLAIGGTLVQGFTSALQADSLNAKVQAQLGLTEKQSGRVGRVAGDLFAGNYGESMEQVNEAVGSVIQNIDGMRGASEKSLTGISTKVLNVSSTFDQDLGGVTRAVSQLMRTGLAKNATEALDIVTRGFQTGADKSEDFLDTLNEYGTQFRKMGIDGKTATGLIQQGLQAGARDGDLVADSIKEFGIRATDGSDASQVAFEKLGLNAQKMTDQIAKGGPAAEKGLSTVLDRLRGMKDPVERSAAAVGLFGTQAEDMGDALYALDPSQAVKGLGQVAGAADKMDKTLADTPAAKMQAFTRQLQQGLTDAFTKYVIPAVEDLMPLLAGLGPILAIVSGAIQGVTGFFREHSTIAKVLAGIIAALVLVTGAHALALGISTGALKAWLIGSKLVQAATRVWTAVQWALNIALNANPIGLIVLAVVALVAVVVLIIRKFKLWDNITRAVGKAWDWLKDKLSKAWEAIKTATTRGVGVVIRFVKGLPGKALDALKSLGTKLRGLFTRAWTAVKTAVSNGTDRVVEYVGDTPHRFMNNLRNVGNLLKGLFKNAWATAKTAVVTGITNIMAVVKGMPGKISALASKFLSAAKTLGGKIITGIKSGLSNVGGVAGDIAQGVGNALQSVINGAINAMNSAIPNKLGFGKFAIDIDDSPIPQVSLATGGRVTGATVALIGEGREAETVLPDSVLRSLLDRTVRDSRAGDGVAHLTITNWRDGTGYLRLLAEGAVAEDARFRRHVGAMNA